MKRKNLMTDVILILVIVSGIFWIGSKFIYMGRSGYTDNAQVRQYIVPVNTRVQGFVKKVWAISSRLSSVFR